MSLPSVLAFLTRIMGGGKTLIGNSLKLKLKIKKTRQEV
jgi:hypothetical protein